MGVAPARGSNRRREGAWALSRDRWVGIDQGYSQLGVAIVDADGAVLASERSRTPDAEGHDRDVALARLRGLLDRLKRFRDLPVRLAGYCYEDSGVAAAFAAAGWTVAGTKALNDVVGVYGLGEMRGHTVVAGCGTYSQVVYVDERQAVRWPGADVAAELPGCLPSGPAYARFVAGRGWAGDAAEVEASARLWAELGPMLSAKLDEPESQAFLTRTAAAVVQTRDVLWRHSAAAQPPNVVLGGGAVGDPRLWRALQERLREDGVPVRRAEGDPAVGLARFALAHPHADPWAVIGKKRPGWLG